MLPVVPAVMAKQVSLLPAVTLLSQIIFSFFFGFLGLLLALPMVIVCQIWGREVLVKDILDPWNQPSSPGKKSFLYASLNVQARKALMYVRRYNNFTSHSIKNEPVRFLSEITNDCQ